MDTHTRGTHDRARWAVPVAVMLLVGALSVAPLQMVGAPIQLPSLDWFEEGHTFYYHLTNGTATYDFNATIVNVTDDTTTWRFWNHFNGSDQAFQHLPINKTREHLNFTGAYTLMWVNKTNVDTGSATIGTETYSLNALESDTEVLVFEGDGKRFEYDAENGWLLEMRSDESPTVWELNATGDEHGQIDPVEATEGVGCEDPYYRFAYDRGFDRESAMVSEVAVCAKPNDDDTSCYWRLKGRSTIRFPETFLHEHNGTHTFVDEDGAIIGEAHYEYTEDPPPLSQVNHTRIEYRNTTVQSYTPSDVDYTTLLPNEADLFADTERWDGTARADADKTDVVCDE